MAAQWEHKLLTYKVGGIKGVDYAMTQALRQADCPDKPQHADLERG